jgi:hypothetical protein
VARSAPRARLSRSDPELGGSEKRAARCRWVPRHDRAHHAPGPPGSRPCQGAGRPRYDGFGLLGHLLEMCRGAGLTARVQMSSVPLLDNVLALAERGFVTGALGRNWASYGTSVQLAPGVTSAQQALLCGPADVRWTVGCVCGGCCGGGYGGFRASGVGRSCCDWCDGGGSFAGVSQRLTPERFAPRRPSQLKPRPAG